MIDDVLYQKDGDKFFLADDSLQKPFINGDALSSLILFGAMSTQWNVGGMGGTKIGLKYEVIDFVAKSIDIDVTTVVFALLQIIEREILEKEYSKHE